MEPFSKNLMDHVTSTTITLPPRRKNDLVIKGVFYNYKNKRQPCVILIKAPSQNISEMKLLAKYLSLMGYSCLVLRLKYRKNKEQSVELNVRYVTQVIERFRKPKTLPNFLKKSIKEKSIGLIGFSDSCELCHIVGHINKKRNWLKGIFTIAPTFTFSYLPSYHPLFLLLGTADYLANNISWDSSNIEKSGLIIQGGRHDSFFSPLAFEPNETDPKFILTDKKSQFRILMFSLYFFFKEVFKHNKGNQLNALQKLKNIFKDDIGLLYHNPLNKRLIEGSDFKKLRSNEIVLKKWKGKFTIGKKTVKERPNDCLLINSRGKFSKKRFLLPGLDQKSNIFNIAVFRSLVWEYCKAVRLAQAPKSELIDELIDFLKKSINQKKIKSGQFLQAKHYPILQCLIKELKKFINTKDIEWSKLRKIFHGEPLKSAEFLLKIIHISIKLNRSPWRHLAYGRELKWDTSRTRKKIKYSLDNLQKIKIKENCFLSLRLGQSYKFRWDEQGNTPLKALSLDVIFYEKRKRHKPINIQINYPISRRKIEASDRNDIFSLQRKLFFDTMPNDIEFQCYLMNHFIPIPPGIKRLQKIELHFLNRTGAIMLSEVALTN